MKRPLTSIRPLRKLASKLSSYRFGIVGAAAALLEIPGERGHKDNLEALQQTKQGKHNIPEEHEEPIFFDGKLGFVPHPQDSSLFWLRAPMYGWSHPAPCLRG